MVTKDAVTKVEKHYSDTLRCFFTVQWDEEGQAEELIKSILDDIGLEERTWKATAHFLRGYLENGSLPLIDRGDLESVAAYFSEGYDQALKD